MPMHNGWMVVECGESLAESAGNLRGLVNIKPGIGFRHAVLLKFKAGVTDDQV